MTPVSNSTLINIYGGNDPCPYNPPDNIIGKIDYAIGWHREAIANAILSYFSGK